MKELSFVLAPLVGGALLACVLIAVCEYLYPCNSWGIFYVCDEQSKFFYWLFHEGPPKAHWFWEARP